LKIPIIFYFQKIFFKIVGLPLTVDSQVQPFFTRFENRATAAFETMNDELLGTNRFKAPTDWKGYRHDGEKVGIYY